MRSAVCQGACLGARPSATAAQGSSQRISNAMARYNRRSISKVALVASRAAGSVLQLGAPVVLTGFLGLQVAVLPTGPALAEEIDAAQHLATITASEASNPVVWVTSDPTLPDPPPAAPALSVADLQAELDVEQPPAVMAAEEVAPAFGSTVDGAAGNGVAATTPAAPVAAAGVGEDLGGAPVAGAADVAVTQLPEVADAGIDYTIHEDILEILRELPEVEGEVSAAEEIVPREVAVVLERELEAIEAQTAALEKEEATTPGAPRLLGEAEGILAKLEAVRGLLREVSGGLVGSITSGKLLFR